MKSESSPSGPSGGDASGASVCASARVIRVHGSISGRVPAVVGDSPEPVVGVMSTNSGGITASWLTRQNSMAPLRIIVSPAQVKVASEPTLP